MFNVKKILIATVLATSCVVAGAWGAKEQGALVGIIVGGAVMANQNEHRQQPPLPVYQQYPDYRVCGYNVVCQQPQIQRYCYDQFVYDRMGVIVGVRKVCE